MPDSPPTEAEIVNVLTGAIAMAETIKSTKLREAATDGMTELCALVIALRRRVETLESQTSPKYLGVWKQNLEYSEGSFVTHDGSIWHANKSTKARPGGGSADWTLACKHGADGKDAR